MGRIEMKAEDCCVCCATHTPSRGGDGCFCSCCPCPWTGCLEFSIIACKKTMWPSTPYSGYDPPDVQGDCDCMSCFEIQLEPRIDECMYHWGDDSPVGLPATSCSAQFQAGERSAGTGGFQEVWGFSGKMLGDEDCDDGPFGPPWLDEECEGQCTIMSLCCPRTGIFCEDTTDPSYGECAEDHPCPIKGASSQDILPCLHGDPGHEWNEIMDPYPEHICRWSCGCFVWSHYDCYDYTGDGVPDSPCSPCAAWTGMGGAPVTVPGQVGDWPSASVGAIVSGQCRNHNTGRKFMIMVHGWKVIQCDCQTGVQTMPYPGTNSVSPVIMEYTGLFTECS